METPGDESQTVLTALTVDKYSPGDGRRDSLSLESYKFPKAWIFKGIHRAKVDASVCEDCGYVMLFADPVGVRELKEGLNQEG
ncbi:hypothetical protein [Roseibacillus persicicus]|uniref:Uncharacterized protein n=1 Tax=Roseibacillus persicicus TaxID=454148 RepID=A0A918TK00_9BACT|nr:hypothetical protein [Roseibacillus persicicus]GHC51647.1 hypothetical protein GCM10007100_17350 [Roseibacillus persicicus]